MKFYADVLLRCTHGLVFLIEQSFKMNWDSKYLKFVVMSTSSYSLMKYASQLVIQNLLMELWATSFSQSH